MKKFKNKSTVMLLINDVDNIIHKINDVYVHSYNGSFKVLNPLTGWMHYFESEKDAVDFCLDNYKGTSTGIQINILK